MPSPVRHYDHFVDFGNSEDFRARSVAEAGAVRAYNQSSGMNTLRLVKAGRLG
jgi:hypothetical protein